MNHAANLSERNRDPRERPYNTVLRNPPNVWDDSDEGEPKDFIIDYENLEAVLHTPDAIKRFGFELFDVIEQDTGASHYARRYVRFADENQAVLLDEITTWRIACCMERHGFTFNFAYDDEEQIDSDDNYQRFSKGLRTTDVRKFDLVLRLLNEGTV